MVKGSGGSAVKPAIDARTAAASLFPPIRPRLGQALCALLFAVVVSSPGHAHENVSGEPPVHPEITPAQAAFDKMFWDIDDGKFPLDSRAQTFATLARLEQAIPPGDVHRQLQYRYMHCLIGFNHDAVGAVEYARAGAEAALAAGDEASEAALRACMASTCPTTATPRPQPCSTNRRRNWPDVAAISTLKESRWCGAAICAWTPGI